MSAARTATRSGSRYVVGIDPGGTGAACLLDGRRLLLVLSWRPSVRSGRRGFLVSTRAIGRSVDLWRSTAGEIGRDLVGEVVRLVGVGTSLGVAIEDVYVGKSVRTAIDLARTSGSLVGPIEALSGERALVVGAAEWRAQVIGLARRSTKREDAKAAAIERIPPLVEGWTLLVDRTTEHVADAVGIALARAKTTNGGEDG